MSKISRLPDLVIGDVVINPPIVQGGMGVRVSNASLVSTVCNQGGLGILASVGLGEDGDHSMDYKQRSTLALRNMIKQARELTKRPFGVNIMFALSNFVELVKICDEEKVGFIFSGAGLPMQLPSLITNNVTKLVPIISSARAIDIICKTWSKRYNRFPDAFVLEGPLAGGHIGFPAEQLLSSDNVGVLEKVLLEVLDALKAYESSRKIPVIVAGGIYDGKDIARVLKLGASGVQMATRFICTDECDVSKEYKNEILRATKDDIVIITSPAGMPARVVKNKFVTRVQSGEKVKFDCKYQCLKTCDPNNSKYCLAQALVNAYRGDIDNGFAMCGANAARVDKIIPVKQLMDELVREAVCELNR